MSQESQTSEKFEKLPEELQDSFDVIWFDSKYIDSHGVTITSELYFAVIKFIRQQIAQAHAEGRAEAIEKAKEIVVNHHLISDDVAIDLLEDFSLLTHPTNHDD